MEKYIVSARKYRPVTFDTVVGQPSITATLKNAIRTNHLAQAYLFTGPRGVGKTTNARILAKTINCVKIGDNVEACNSCDSCVAFNEGRSLNIYELDAASNNSVDDIRALVDQVRYAPQLGKYKVYIIDEVHMLSASAFNAFLKTLEEPPAHAIFILATTEKQKIIPTILSRCQIFDFNRISVEDISKHLAVIAKKENVEAEEDALHIIAQKADGALRDALSLFDQLVSFAGNKLSYKQVIENLNILDHDYYFRLTDELHAGNISASLITYNEIVNKGFDGHNFINGLSSHFRDLLVCLDEVTLPLLEVSPSIREKYKVQSRLCSLAWLLKGLDITNTCDYQYKGAKHQRLHVELALMRLCTMTTGSQQNPEPPKKKVELNAAPVAGSASPAKTISNPPAPQPISEAKEISPEIKTENKAAQSPVAEKKTPSSGPGRKSISITGALSSKQEEKTPEINAESLPDLTKAYTDQELINAWNDFASLLQTQGRLTLHAALIKRTPELSENFTVRFKVDSGAVEKDLNEIKPDLLSFIRKKLSNYSVQVIVEVILGDDTGQIPYTPSEKFKKLAEKNPLLNEMKNQFDLEIDY
ncbi:MAG: DNA polymerase III subunit gamma/tau [Bacteroidetes bacterium]|nr:MAG: DNA polymerase III subunit gamma/tau [Bacteroidota bacterium]